MTVLSRSGVPAVLFGVVFFCFSPALENGFVYDDKLNFESNPHYRGLSGSNLAWMFTETKGHYIPVTWLTLGLDFLLWEMNPWGYHLTNLLLHALNAVLLYALALALLRRFAPARERVLVAAATAAALFFAIHPLRVESVAWVTERRDLVCGTFFLLALTAYLHMQGRDTKRTAWYAASVGCFALSLLSKTMGMALPVVLMVLDVYPLRRRAEGWGRLLVEKIPYLVPALAAVALTYLTTTRGGAMFGPGQYAALDRVLQPGYRFSFYLWKTVLPFGLSPLYAFRNIPDPWTPPYLLCGVGVMVATVVLILLRSRTPIGVSTWTCYGVMISPVLGFLQAGPHFAADRYTYLACLPWALLVGAAVIRFRWCGPLAAVVLVGLGTLSYRQTRVWRDNVTLWTRAIDLDSDNSFAYYCRGGAWKERGNFPRAFSDYDEAIRGTPRFAAAYHDRGSLRSLVGDFDGAVADYTRAIEIDPGHFWAFTSRGIVRAQREQFQGAMSDFDQAVRIHPRYGEAYYFRGLLKLGQGDREGALADLTAAIESEPTAPAHTRRALIVLERGEIKQAVADYTDAIRLDPDFADAYMGRAELRHRQGDLPGALADCTDVVRLRPNRPASHANRGLVRRAMGDLRGSEADYTEAIRLSPHDAMAYFDRAVTRRQAGDPQGAMADFGEVIRLNPQGVEGYLNRGILRMRVGSTDEAAKDFRKALEIAPPEWPGRPEAQRLLQEAEGP